MIQWKIFQLEWGAVKIQIIWSDKLGTKEKKEEISITEQTH